jgi:hypothetical protein
MDSGILSTTSGNQISGNTVFPSTLAIPARPTDDQLIEQNYIAASRYLDNSNSGTLNSYELAVDSYKRNKAINDVIGKPTPKPTPPNVLTLDHDEYVALYKAWMAAMDAWLQTPSGSSPSLDISGAIKTAPAPDALADFGAPAAPVAQPAMPLGADMGGGFYAAAPGDTLPNGSVFTTPFQTRFVKHVIVGPFGTQAWWQIA